MIHVEHIFSPSIMRTIKEGNMDSCGTFTTSSLTLSNIWGRKEPSESFCTQLYLTRKQAEKIEIETAEEIFERFVTFLCHHLFYFKFCISLCGFCFILVILFLIQSILHVFVTFSTILTILWLTWIILWFMLVILCVFKVVFVKQCSCCSFWSFHVFIWPFCDSYWPFLFLSISLCFYLSTLLILSLIYVILHHF